MSESLCDGGSPPLFLPQRFRAKMDENGETKTKATAHGDLGGTSIA